MRSASIYFHCHDIDTGATCDIVDMLVERICRMTPEGRRDDVDLDLKEQMQCIVNRHADRREQSHATR